ncbi:nicotinate-nucleotide adenylyltransferase [Mariprofundus micogutta]|uniref:Probable nicotinate-nucleotide adenylyltransferase n=1 Tax=Mariprofundus micogutta TaxID=1921010 RepID=A0A1L8CMG7_9PROT|nr:nicotinate (nicotinamide) nucleotide adenylyltransferase [Mariprofundus micogutta]GAV20101.1 nicotinate-nucleotide adenylyltransferase [Mariprofundus micogutta]
MKQIGLFGGSFDPPHLGHLALVQAGLDSGLDEVWVIPAYPVHRELSGLADGGVRLMWLEKIFAGHSRVKVLDWEVSQQQPTPAVDTLRRFSAEYPGITPWLMLGADAWAGFESWREYPAHRLLCNVAVFARQGIDKQAVLSHSGWQKMDPEQLSECDKPGHWCFVELELPDISATLIREYAAQGRSLADLVPAAVCADIEKNYTVMKENM